MSKETVLIVEDDEDIRTLLTFNLSGAGFEVIAAADGFEGLKLAQEHNPDLLILDIMLPGMDGFEVCREIKRNPDTKSLPVLMLTARGEEIDRIVGLELGADDYVVKPFSPRELLLRVKAILKRAALEKAKSQTDKTTEPGEAPQTRASWSRDGLAVDFEAHKVRLNDDPVQLTATEFRLLSELIHSKGRVRTREQLLNTVWGYEFEGYARTVDTHVRRLRQKLGEFADYVETVRGVGYRFKE